MTDGQEIIIYNSPDGIGSVALMAKDGSIWLSQNQLAELFDTSRVNITLHINNILKDKKLDGIQNVSITYILPPTEKTTRSYSIPFI